MKRSKWLQRRLERERQERLQRFLDGFKYNYLLKVVHYYDLNCADTRQLRCIYKSIKQAKLDYQDIWRALIYEHKSNSN
ncbi:hypothetical protein WEU38_10990 [Cyanobacterium aponinum AL20118]|uniref:Uncharacterized protein n=1 Tax=Cyanobacterium aponinum AL20115 TaxID=3090662 RepID=A0AAF1C090_9CHRO|nr:MULTISPECIES: hypothetical protein [Cyanobacterium]WPF87337.1 hypothetical protein SAY89_11020 [Cyanobacterium aponinum AL20115]WVL00474.1 hypothetical protein Dongsha4_17780 [Cyanobacterium sp. Dongsha4]